MSFVSRIKPHADTVMGIDASTKSIAFCIMRGKDVVKYGEIFINGANISERILDSKRKMRALKNEFKVDYIVIESAIMVRSAAVAIKMAYVFGAIMGELLDNGAVVKEVAPITWQSYIGNKNLNKQEKLDMRKSFPDKSASWYNNKSRETRKQRTLDFFNTKFGIALESDNVSDAFGLAWYASQNLTER